MLCYLLIAGLCLAINDLCFLFDNYDCPYCRSLEKPSSLTEPLWNWFKESGQRMTSLKSMVVSLSDDSFPFTVMLIFFNTTSKLVSHLTTPLARRYQHSRQLVKMLNQFADLSREVPDGWEKKLNRQGRVCHMIVT